MQTNKQQNIAGYYVTIFLAMCLNIFPLPVFFKNLNPDWVLLVLIYWVFAFSDRIGVFNAWGVGILVDILTGRLLGQHALAYTIVVYTILKQHKRLSNYLMPQQIIFVFFCLFFSQTVAFWMENMQGQLSFFHVLLLPVLCGALLWPLLSFAFGYLFGVRRFG